MSELRIRAVAGIPEVQPGDDLAALILAAAGPLRPGLVVAVAHTAVSKAEGAIVELSGVRPGEEARRLAAPQGRDPRVLQVVLDQSERLVRVRRGVIVSRTRHGFVCANAGVDASNAGAGERVIVLPDDPDASARGIRRGLAAGGAEPAPAVLVTDSFGRAWRNGQVDVAVGLAGMAPLDDWRGRRDAQGLELQATWLAVADAAAAAADLVRAKDSREPVVIIEGLERFVTAEDGPGAAALIRPPEEDMFL